MSTKGNTRLWGLASIIGATVALLAGASQAGAAPVWEISANHNPTAAPGSVARFYVRLINVGDKPAPEKAIGNEQNCTPGAPGAVPTNCSTVTANFSPGITPIEVEGIAPSDGAEPCAVTAASITCSLANYDPSFQYSQIWPRRSSIGGSERERALSFMAEVNPGTEGKTLTSSFTVAGAGAGADTTAAAVVIDPAFPEFGVAGFDTKSADDPQGNPFTQAAGHPYDLTTYLKFYSHDNPLNPFKGDFFPVEPVRDVVVDLPPGLVGDPTIADQCTIGELIWGVGAGEESRCPPASQVGKVFLDINNVQFARLGPVPIFSMPPPPGSAARFGFNAVNVAVVLDAKLRGGPGGDYGISIVSSAISEGLAVQGTEVTFWGAPADEAHRGERACPGLPTGLDITCSAGGQPAAFLREPTACPEAGHGLEWTVKSDSWFDPGALNERGEPDLSDPAWDEDSFISHEAPGFPYAPDEWGDAQGPTRCDLVPVKGTLDAQPTALDTETPTGLEVHVEVPNPGLENPEGIASSDLKKVEVSLPQGVTINPSQAEGLGICKPAQYESTELSFFPTSGTGCPDDSKIGTVQVKTPLLEETIPGEVFLAQQDDPSTTTPGAENPFDSLLALYVVLKEPQRGILITLPGKVETDKKSGRIVTTFDDLPQLPFSSFDFKFREGARAPLVTPPTCGTYETTAEFTGHSAPAHPITSTSSFEIVHGLGGGPCPPGGIPPFKPGFTAGAINNNAGSFSPFNLRLTRFDGEQDLTKFSSILPPGAVAKIAGVEKCSEAAIATAKGKTGRQELASPSCPAGSQIGRSMAGAGVGSVLTYVPGKIYLAGPWNGAPLSVVAITPAVAGPFDVGAVVVRQALTLDPVTGEVHVDGDKSDPIPHILEGIPLKLRDLRVYVDRENFTINPTSCDPSQVRATLFGSFADVFSDADDKPVELSSRYQAANCSRLGFKPVLTLNLKGGTRRGGHPGLKGVLRPRSGDANISGAVVKLPRSAFLDQAHIRTICTRVQFAADACPKGAIYGKVTAFSPLLDEPLKGPAYLRSSNNKLPDLVFDLKGIVDIETAARIDSVQGGIRATFPFVPDAPISKVIVEMQGGKKGLIVNSRNLCRSANRAEVQLDAHNGKIRDFNPVLRPDCRKRHKSAR